MQKKKTGGTIGPPAHSGKRMSVIPGSDVPRFPRLRSVVPLPKGCKRSKSAFSSRYRDRRGGRSITKFASRTPLRSTCWGRMTQ